MIIGFNYDGVVYRGVLLETSIDDDGDLVKKITISHKDGEQCNPKNIEYTGPILHLVGSE